MQISSSVPLSSLQEENEPKCLFVFVASIKVNKPLKAVDKKIKYIHQAISRRNLIYSSHSMGSRFMMLVFVLCFLGFFLICVWPLQSI